MGYWDLFSPHDHIIVHAQYVMSTVYWRGIKCQVLTYGVSAEENTRSHHVILVFLIEVFSYHEGRRHVDKTGAHAVSVGGMWHVTYPLVSVSDANDAPM